MLLFPKIPASFGWQWTDPQTRSYTVFSVFLISIFWICSVCKKALKYIFSRNEYEWKQKNLKDYCKGTVYFTEYQYSLTLHKMYIEKSLFWCTDWQTMNKSNFKNLISHCNIFFPKKDAS